ncbi:hypothetical protein [Streptomyces sp. NPDC088400]|uniref:hypothetical protein n=1 Tax=Streptomyces sp. NPDC088400 TaxID=3365861 RepID=UPI0038089D11
MSETNPASVATDANQAENISIQGGPESVSDLRSDLYKTIDPIRNALGSLDDVHAVSVFEAILFAPGSLDTYPPRSPDGRPARFDSIIVIETRSPADMDAVRSTPAFGELLDTVRGRSTYTEVITVTNVKKIADVDRRNPGVFLFNFFFAEDPQRLLDIWDYTAGWWETVGKMHNSELLVPTSPQGTPYAIINNARWDTARPALDAFRDTSYSDYVLANIDASKASAMPSLYRWVQ